MSGPYALISVYDKQGVVELAQAAVAAGYRILSTGGTSRELRKAGVTVTDVSKYTGFPEILDGRVKTLHPKIHAGLLARRDRQDHYLTMIDHDIESIDLVVVNLYPFAETIDRDETTEAEAIEQIDIGGPTMLRAAAKNHEFVTVVGDPTDYPEVMKALASGAVPIELKRKLAAKVFAITAEYDSIVSCWLGGQHVLPSLIKKGGVLAAVGAERNEPAVEPAAPVAEPVADPDPAPLPEARADGSHFTLEGELVRTLRYGENPHQSAAFYRCADAASSTIAAARFLGANKELSYNNILDLDAALGLVREFVRDDAACAIIKHNNPCGCAVGPNLAAAFAAAHAGDPLSAFGSIVACSIAVDHFAAQQMAEPGHFLEAVIAPSFSDEAVETLRGAKFGKNLRLLETGALDSLGATQLVRSVGGGFLVQEADTGGGEDLTLEYVTARRPSYDELKDLRFAWAVVKHVRSNAIVLVKDGATVGVGAGQMSRVDAVEIAVEKAGDRARGAVLASDAFFPFPDGLLAAAGAGVTAAIQPGGSRKDGEVIEAANEKDVAMVLTGMRHFKH